MPSDLEAAHFDPMRMGRRVTGDGGTEEGCFAKPVGFDVGCCPPGSTDDKTKLPPVSKVLKLREDVRGQVRTFYQVQSLPQQSMSPFFS